MPESAEVLVKPAKDIIEFDPIVSDEAFRLTRGQPQLLQSLGMAMICNFNSVIFSGKTRSDYADLNDLNQAAETVLQQHNSAFTQHWEHADIATHRVLSALAWALDETNRPQMDIDGIEDMMRQTRLQLSRERTFRILEQLLEEEFLIGEGVTYRFAVPLYRRWIAWRWQPEKVRQEGEKELISGVSLSMFTKKNFNINN